MRSRKVPFVSIAVVIVRLSRRPCILMSEVRPLRLSSPRAGPSGIMVRYAERDAGFSNDMPETISKCYMREYAFRVDLLSILNAVFSALKLAWEIIQNERYKESSNSPPRSNLFFIPSSTPDLKASRTLSLLQSISF